MLVSVAKISCIAVALYKYPPPPTGPKNCMKSKDFVLNIAEQNASGGIVNTTARQLDRP